MCFYTQITYQESYFINHKYILKIICLSYLFILLYIYIFSHTKSRKICVLHEPLLTALAWVLISACGFLLSSSFSYPTFLSIYNCTIK